MIEYKIVIVDKARSYNAVPTGAKIVAVNGREVIDYCEGCGKPILEGAFSTLWQDGVVTCRKCSPTKRDAATLAREDAAERAHGGQD